MKYITIGLILLCLFFVACSKNGSTEKAELADTTPQSVTVEGMVFENLPGDLANALKSSETGKIPYYGDIEKLHAYNTQGKDNPDILLALALLQANVVESGIYIDDLREHLEIGRKFSEDYFNMLMPDIPKEKFLLVADKLENLEIRLQEFEANPP